MEKILVSACLMGKNVKYDGGSNLLDNPTIKKWEKEGRLVLVCPEADGGLSIPRHPCEILKNKVINSIGEDVTENFKCGAQIALDTAKENNIKYALLKERSPSCGGKKIYDGTFSKKLIDGQGISARLLTQNGITVFGESEINLLSAKFRSDKIPENIKSILKKLEDKGFEAYLAGGCVRDILMGKTPFDYDITTNAKPEETMKVFENHTTIPTGIAHGTVTVVSEGENVEITTYRIDGEYKDNRHPEKVIFSKSIEEDLSRRDFSMNSMAMDTNGNIIDPFGGEKSIEDGIISCVGDPDTRFNEDGLRILRSIRFASTLSFEIEEETKKSVLKNKHLLKNISAERIFAELKKLLIGNSAGKIIFEFFPVLCEIMPFLEKGNLLSVYKDFLRSPKDLSTRLALFLDGLTLEEARDILNFLKTDNKTKKTVLMLIDNKELKIQKDRISIKKLLNKYEKENLILLLNYKEIFEKDFSKEKEMIEKIINCGQVYKQKDLAINGNDLLNEGFKGAEIAVMMQEIVNMVIEEKLPNEKEILINYAKKTSE